MSESKDYIEMAFRSIQCFDNEGKLNNKELNNTISIAERDGVIDQNEIRVLQKIISKIKTDEIDDTSLRRLKLLAKKISV